ncbi:ROK family protein [Microbacterium sp.]|uniref:ROK family transcriptional regulator n=1 Tax=Microbacterium sp. TaxID=51671 RepID=UPI0028A79285|nr:ROK family protein [Microbacterium sp.]
MTALTPNAQRLLRTLVADGPAYRADLARTLGVSRATVTNLANRLSSDGLIEETDPEPGALKNLIGTTPKLGVLASVMFLVDTCTASIATLDGTVLKSLTLGQLIDVTADARLTAGADLLGRLLAEFGLEPADLRALHLAVDTQMDARSGEVYAQRASSRWYGVNPKQYFTERFAVPVHTENTARLEGLAEYLWGAGRGHDNVLYVEVSHGVTSGHMIKGQIQTGARGGSGELGHTIYDWNGPLCTCGNSGCLMQYASVPAMLRDAGTGTGRTPDWDEFVALAREGDPAVAAITRRAATVLGRVLINACHMVDPEIVVLSGEIPRALPGFADMVAEQLRDHALPLVARNIAVRLAELGYEHAASARAGIESLRAIEDVVAEAIHV